MKTTTSWLRRLRARITGRPHPAPVCRLRVESLEDRTVPSTVSGTVFQDLNANGLRDPGEAVLAGQTVFIDANRNGSLDGGEASATTAADGTYALPGLADGTYPVALDTASGFTQTGGVFVNGPGSGMLGEVRVDFRSPEPGALPNGFTNYAGIAWANGSLYVTQVGVNQVAGDTHLYQLDPATGSILSGPVTIPDNIGDIAFDGTNFWGADWQNDWIIKFDPAGQELARFQLPGGTDVNSLEWANGSLWVVDNLSQKALHEVDPVTHAVVRSIPLPNANVGGVTFDGSHFWVNNRDTDRVFEVDPGTGSVGRSVPAPGGFAYGLAFDGQFLWLADNQLVADNWQGRVFQYDIGAPARVVTVAGVDVGGVDLGLAALGSVSGTVFSDHDSDGTRDPGEGGLSGWRLYLDGNGNGRFDPWERNVTTGIGGGYSFADLRPGTHMVAEDLAAKQFEMPHWAQTAPVGGGHTVTFPQAGTVAGLDFGNHLDRSDPAPTDWATGPGGRMNLYTGLAWVDEFDSTGSTNYSWAANYADNSTRNGYSDWRLPTKDEALNAAHNGASTAGFLSLNAFPSYWTSTAATNKLQYVVDIWNPNAVAGTAPLSNGARALAMVRDTALYGDDGGAGYSDTGNWTQNGRKETGGYLGDYRTAAAGTGSKTATWTFAGLEAGASYKVVVTWKALATNASDAPYTVLDGGNAVATVAVNQRIAPDDLRIANVGWEGLGTFTLDSTTLAVRLSNSPNGTVMADGVRIYKVADAPESPLLAVTVGTNDDVSVLALGQARSLLPEAIRQWRATGADVSGLRNLQLQIADLGGTTLGLASGNTITLDDDAAGWGWFVDLTPHSDSEFRLKGDQGEQNRMDLLSVLIHEVGHLLGHGHDGAGVMAATLTPGVRLVPGPMARGIF